MDEADRILNLDFEKEASEYSIYLYCSKKSIPSFSSISFLLKFRFATKATWVVSPQEVHFCRVKTLLFKDHVPPNNPINACIHMYLLSSGFRIFDFEKEQVNILPTVANKTIPSFSFCCCQHFFMKICQLHIVRMSALR